MTLDEECARALGWEKLARGWFPPDSISLDEWNTLVSSLGQAPFPYSSSHMAARLLEDEIERRGLDGKYVAALGEIVPGADWTPYENWGALQVWAFLRATPDQRARAFLKAVEGA